MDAPAIPGLVSAALRVWLDSHDAVSAGTIEGLYVVGSVALGDWTPHSDVDVVAVVADPSDPDLFDELAASQAAVQQRLGVHLDLAERRSWVVENLDTYWRGVADALAAGVAVSDEPEWGGEILEWVALGVARMLYTFETGDVISKSAAGHWAASRVPEHEALFLRASAVRADRGPVTRSELVECADVAGDIVAAVTGR